MYNERLEGMEKVRIPYIAPYVNRMGWFVYVIRLNQEIDRNNEVNSLLVPSEDVELLKDAMERLYHDRELHIKLESNARKSIEKYDIENINKDWINLFKEVYSS
jgi:glycosyltransferase involved in cell wall biosynthesis